jgi:hypothetical protein
VPPRLEKQLLDTFVGYRRPGLARFTGYYPPGFHLAIPSRVFTSSGFQSPNAHATIDRLPVRNALVIAVRSFRAHLRA